MSFEKENQENGKDDASRPPFLSPSSPNKIVTRSSTRSLTPAKKLQDVEVGSSNSSNKKGEVKNVSKEFFFVDLCDYLTAVRETEEDVERSDSDKSARKSSKITKKYEKKRDSTVKSYIDGLSKVGMFQKERGFFFILSCYSHSFVFEYK